MKVKHGVMSLLKHLAQSSSHSSEIHVTLSKAEVIQRVSESGIWDEKADAMAEVVQVSAIGVVKHMCNANGESPIFCRHVQELKLLQWRIRLLSYFRQLALPLQHQLDSIKYWRLSSVLIRYPLRAKVPEFW